MKKNLSKYLMLILLMSFKSAWAQWDTSRIYVGIEAQKNGMHFVPSYEKMFVEGRIKFGATISYHWHAVGNYSFFSIKHQALYSIKNNSYIGIQPLWLRAYSRKIGYQIPTSIVYRWENRHLGDVVVDISYWRGQVYPSITIRKLVLHTTNL